MNLRFCLLSLLLVSCIDGADPSERDRDFDGYPESVDCNDIDPDVNPGAREVCDDENVDEDCNGAADDDDRGVDRDTLTRWYIDADGDGFGSEDFASYEACDPTDPETFVSTPGDCDESNPDVNPAAIEVCDDGGVDEDCDGDVNDDDSDVAYTEDDIKYGDGDGDGYGNPSAPGYQCDVNEYRVDNGWDCDDREPRFHPGAPEDCEAFFDFNCDGSYGYEDLDEDGVVACEDCWDLDPDIGEECPEHGTYDYEIR